MKTRKATIKNLEKGVFEQINKGKTKNPEKINRLAFKAYRQKRKGLPSSGISYEHQKDIIKEVYGTLKEKGVVFKGLGTRGKLKGALKNVQKQVSEKNTQKSSSSAKSQNSKGVYDKLRLAWNNRQSQNKQTQNTKPTLTLPNQYNTQNNALVHNNNVADIPVVLQPNTPKVPSSSKKSTKYIDTDAKIIPLNQNRLKAVSEKTLPNTVNKPNSMANLGNEPGFENSPKAPPSSPSENLDDEYVEAA